MKKRISLEKDNNGHHSGEKVPILRPEEIQKLDTLKRMSIKPDQNQKRISIRQSIRPSQMEGDDRKNKKSQNKKGQQKKEEDSGFTKNSTQRSFENGNGNQKKRKNRALQEGEEKGILCCAPKVEENPEENPFKIARETMKKK